MKRWTFLVLGVLLVIAGIVWILQGFNLLGQSGGMNGKSIWAVIGVLVGLVGLGFLTIGARSGRSARNPSARL